MKKLALALLVSTGAINFCLAQQPLYDVTAGDGNGVRFWQSDAYKIHMGNTAEYHYGPVTDYSTKMNTNGTPGRGWTWGISGQTPVAAIGMQGNMQIAGTFQAATYLAAGYTFVNNVTDANNAWTRSNFGSNVHWDASSGAWQVGAIGNSDFSAVIHPNNDGLAFVTAPSIGNTTRSLTNSQFMAFERMRINANGYVGIGTTSPASKLHISNSNAREALRVYLDGNTTNYMSMWQGTGGAAIDPIGTGVLRLGYDQSTNVIMGITGTGTVSGNVGIGTTTPGDKLSVSGGAITLDADQPLRGGGKWLISGNPSQVTVGTANPGINLRFDAGATGRMFVDGTSGNVGIGTTNPGSYKLAVEGKIGAREVNVIATNPWPDYVFEKDYKLLSLEEIKNYIDQNQHLPEIPSAKEVEKNGVNLGEMNALLLKKIEELTLYTIEMNKKMEEMKKESESAKTQMQNLQKEINQVKK